MTTCKEFFGKKEKRKKERKRKGKKRKKKKTKSLINQCYFDKYFQSHVVGSMTPILSA